MSDTLIHGVVNRRIEEAEAAGDVTLLQQHLSANYDAQVHQAVYRALGHIGGMKSLRILVEAASRETCDETKRVILEAMTDVCLLYTSICV